MTRPVPLAVALRPLLVAGLLVLAGCGGLTGNPATTDDGTVTPAPVPTDSPTPRSERAGPPVPLTEGVPNATAIARRHAAVLERRSYRLRTYVSHSRGDDQGDTVRSTIDQRTYRVQSGGTYRGVRVWVLAGSGTTERLHRWEAYGDGEAEYRMVVTENGTSYERRPLAPTALPPHQGRAVTMLVRYLDVGDPVVEPIRSGRGPRVRVVGRDPRAPGLQNASDYRVEAVLTEAGRVETLEASYVAANGSNVRVGFRVSDVGSVRVNPPSWYDEARWRHLRFGNGTGAPGGASDGDTTTATPGTSRPHPAGQ